MTTAGTFLNDVGSDQDLGGGLPAGCQGKIDFLFVISRLWTMAEIQDKLIAAFPAFIDTIQKAKPTGAKGTYIKKVSLSSTMGPGLKIDLAASAEQARAA